MGAKLSSVEQKYLGIEGESEIRHICDPRLQINERAPNHADSLFIRPYGGIVSGATLSRSSHTSEQKRRNAILQIDTHIYKNDISFRSAGCRVHRGLNRLILRMERIAEKLGGSRHRYTCDLYSHVYHRTSAPIVLKYLKHFDAPMTGNSQNQLWGYVPGCVELWELGLTSAADAML